jgi:membrane protease YdiL (CAAX protease family)
MAAIAMGLVVILQPNDMPNNKFAISTAALTCVLAGAHGIFKGEWEGKNRRVWRLGLHAIYNCGVAASISWCVTAAWVKCLELANAFKISSPMENQPIVETMLGVDDPRELLHWVIPSLLTAPLIEEIVFRGFLYKFLGARAPRPVAAIVSAIIFSALHSNVMVAVPMFVLGLCLVKIYESNGTILATILVHSLFNAINLVSIGSQLR